MSVRVKVRGGGEGEGEGEGEVRVILGGGRVIGAWTCWVSSECTSRVQLCMHAYAPSG